MSQQMYPGAAANDSTQNRSWILQENSRPTEPASDAGQVAVLRSRAAIAVWEDDGGNASYPTGDDRMIRGWSSRQRQGGPPGPAASA